MEADHLEVHDLGLPTATPAHLTAIPVHLTATPVRRLSPTPAGTRHQRVVLLLVKTLTVPAAPTIDP